VACGDWADVCVDALAGRDVLILEDNDETGRKKALEAAAALHGTAKTVRIVQLPGLPEKGDVSDWLDADQSNAHKLADVGFDGPLWTPHQVSASAPTASTNANGLHFARMDEVEAKHVDWLWHARLARGKLTLLAGEPGIGKSQISLDIAARISVGGNWP